MEGVAVERRKIRLRMSLSNLMEFKKDLTIQDYVSSLISEAVRDISIVENGKAVMKGV